MGKNLFSSISHYFLFLMLTALIISPSPFRLANAGIPAGTGDAALRIGALGGTVEVEDPLSPVYKAGITIDVAAYRANDGALGFIKFQAGLGDDQIAAGQTAGSVVDGTDNKVLQISKGAVLTGTLSNISFGNLLVLYIDVNGDHKTDSEDSDGDGKVDDLFLAYKIDKKNINTKKQRITLDGAIPSDKGNILLIQAVQTPEFSIQSVPFPFEWVTKKVLKGKNGKDKKVSIKGMKGKVLGIGPYVDFEINDDVHPGDVSVKYKKERTDKKGNVIKNKKGKIKYKIKNTKINKFDKKVKIVLPYDKDAVSALGLDTDKFRIYSLSENKFEAVKVKGVIETEGVVTATVKHLSIYQVVVPFKENNSISYVYDAKVKIKGKNAKIKYSLADANNDPSDVKIEYRNNPSADANAGWKAITTKKGIKPGKRSFNWKVGSLKTGYYQVRVTPSQKINGKKVSTIGAGSNVFYVNNGKAKSKSPSGLKGTVDNGDEFESAPQVSLSWNERSSASSYNVYRQARFNTGGREKTFRFIASTTAITHTDTTIPKTFYEAAYQVTSVDSSGRESKFVSNKKELRVASIVISGYY